MVSDEQGASGALCLALRASHASAVFAALLALGCAQPSPPAAAGTRAPALPAAPVPSAAPLQRLERAERRVESFSLPRVTAPKAHERIAATRAAAYPLALDVSSTPANATLALALDGGRPRPLAMFTSAPKLGDLADQGALADGAHVVLALFMGEGGIALAAPEGQPSSARVAFFVGDGRAAPPLPRVACLSPWGTLYGARAKRALLDFLPLEGVISAVEVTLTGPSGTRRALAAGAPPFVLGDLPSGDYEMRLDPEGAPDAAAVPCVFTVNRELEGPA
jgi:hypothetical protein